ncbi:MAG: FecR domain-containing protein [Cystobacter sp.]
MSTPEDSFGRTWRWGVALALLLALGAGWFFLGLFEPVVPAPGVSLPVAPARPSAPGPVPAEVAAEVATRAQVIEVVGEVERSHGETWAGLRVGDLLAPDDAVRTGPGARVDLRVGDDASRLSVPERSEVRVGELTRALHTFRLERGRLDVDYRRDEERVLRVSSQGGTVAETREARFSLLRRGSLVAVVTRGGVVDLSSAGTTIQVGEGQQALTRDGAKPEGAQPIPLDVLLKVARTPTRDTLCLSLSGKVRVGTEVWVEDAPVEVSEAGDFRADVPQATGRSRVKVLAREVGGTTREVSLACRFGPEGGSTQTKSVKFRWNEAP